MQEPSAIQAKYRRLHWKLIRRAVLFLLASLRQLLYWKWRLFAARSPLVPNVYGACATVIVSTYSPERTRNIWPLVSYLRKCQFVDRIVISNNNPDLRLIAPEPLRDSALTLLNQNVRRGPGYSWLLAAAETGQYFICLDDDFLAYPRQLAALFGHLLADTTVPHGIAGKINQRYVVRREAEVDDLYVAYAVTRQHIATYQHYLAELAGDFGIAEAVVEFWADDVVISRAGPTRARVHDVGYLHLCPTADAQDVAVYQQQGFKKKRIEVTRAIDAIQAQSREGARRQ